MLNLGLQDDYYYGPREYQLVERFKDTALVIIGTGWGKGTLKIRFRALLWRDPDCRGAPRALQHDQDGM